MCFLSAAHVWKEALSARWYRSAAWNEFELCLKLFSYIIVRLRFNVGLQSVTLITSRSLALFKEWINWRENDDHNVSLIQANSIHCAEEEIFEIHSWNVSKTHVLPVKEQSWCKKLSPDYSYNTRSLMRHHIFNIKWWGAVRC